jgi:hypothetical protein
MRNVGQNSNFVSLCTLKTNALINEIKSLIQHTMQEALGYRTSMTYILAVRKGSEGLLARQNGTTVSSVISG